MTRSGRHIGIAGAWLLVVVIALSAVQRHEQTLEQGQFVLLRLAPVDPRSLMQGDYMALRFSADSDLTQRMRDSADSGSVPTFAHFVVDDEGRATLNLLGDTPIIAPGTVSMHIRSIDGEPSVGPNAFFFQEGMGELFEAAQWGGFRVAPDGAALLVSLHDTKLKLLGTQQR